MKEGARHETEQQAIGSLGMTINSGNGKDNSKNKNKDNNDNDL